jgi:hypothetical protein
MGHLIERGRLYNPNRKSWPEGVYYQCRSGEHELLLFLSEISAAERQAVRTGKAEFGLLVQPPTIMFLYRFGDALPWSDSPFSIHLVADPAERIVPPVPAKGQRTILTAVLVEAPTGIVEGIRALSLSAEFGRLASEAIADQLAAPFDQAGYDTALQRLYDRYPQTAAMVPNAAILEVGGKV